MSFIYIYACWIGGPVDIQRVLAFDCVLAAAGQDYMSVLSTLAFTSSMSRLTQRVNISEDDIDEPDESFSAQLSLVTADPRVQIAPATARIDIRDNDGKDLNSVPNYISSSIM